jgi:hydroxymethylbilane synthase
MKFTIGTRGSKLALWQANHVKSLLEKNFPKDDFQLKIIKTTGDLDQKTPLNQMGGIGLFTKQIEKALKDKEIDLAVHSYKDMPSVIDTHFEIAAVLQREVPFDIFISKKYKLEDMKKGLIAGTGSLRRISQLKAAFPEIITKELRGNVDTRLRKLEEGEYDGIILAYAGVKRLGLLDNINFEIIPENISLPAVAQGAVAVEVRKGEKEIIERLKTIDHDETHKAVDEERTFLRIVEGGCKVPVACYGKFENDKFILSGFVGDLNGKEIIKHTVEVPATEMKEVGSLLAKTVLNSGGDKILQQFR